MSRPSAVEHILDAARWAPSGDNAQPWSFEIRGENELAVLIHMARGNVYEYRSGEPTLISAGALLENIVLAAPGQGKQASWRYRGFDNDIYHIAVQFEARPVEQHPLLEQIRRRSVDRWPYRMTKLRPEAKSELVSAVDGDIQVEWHESLAARWRIARLTAVGTVIRLRIPETFDIHRKIVDWNRACSPDAIPARAIGLDAVTLKFMRWTMADWERTRVANRLGSPFFASLQMDLLPGLCSAAYFVLRMGPPARGSERVDQLLRAGQSMQRFWLTATRLGLAMQPCLAVLAFSHYGATKEAFTSSAREREAAARLAYWADEALSCPQELVFLARIGLPKPRKLESRSTRKPLTELIRDPV